MAVAHTVATTRATRRVNVVDRRAVWRRMDWMLVAATAALLVVGSVLVWSATEGNEALSGGDGTAYLTRHLTNIVIGLVLAWAVAATDHRWLRIWTPVVYVGAIIGLVLVLSPLGAVINGSRSWIVVGGTSVQPAEFAKLGVVVAMALVLAEKTEARRASGSLRDADVLAALVVAAIPAALIMAQPDLGTMLVLSVTVFGVIAVAGAPKRWLIGLAAAAVTAAFAAVALGFLHGYQLTLRTTRVAPATTPRRRGSPSAMAASSGRACSTARRRSRASFPSSTRTSCSRWRARSSG
jgi:rod shape determining protein RodA